MVAAVHGLELAALATCSAADVCGAGAVLDNAAVLARTPGLAARWTPESIVERLGVARRGWVRDHGATELDLALPAARAALARAGRAPAELDLLVAATSTPSRATASLAGRLAASLGTSCAAFDVRAGGTAGLTAWAAAARWLAAEPTGTTALVVATDCVSPWLDLEQESPEPLLFADGAAALVLRRADVGAAGLAHVRAGTAPPSGAAFTVPGVLPPTADDLGAGLYRFRSATRETAERMRALRIEVCASLVPHGPVQHLFPFAPSSGSARDQGAALGLGPDAVHTCLTDWGCPGSAAPLVALARSHDDLPAGARIALSAVAGGIHWIGLVWTLPERRGASKP